MISDYLLGLIRINPLSLIYHVISVVFESGIVYLSLGISLNEAAKISLKIFS